MSMPKIKPIKTKSLAKKSAADLKSLIKSKTKKTIKPVEQPAPEAPKADDEEQKAKPQEPKISDQTKEKIQQEF